MPNDKQQVVERSPLGFVFKSHEYQQNCWHVHFSRDKKDEYPPKIGEVAQKDFTPDKGKWHICGFGSGHDFDLNGEMLKYAARFDTREDAAKALYTMLKAINANPLPDALRQFIADRARALADRKQRLMTEFSDLNRERSFLTHLAKQYNMGSTTQMGKDADYQTALDNLVEFLTENEDALYEVMGKEEARTFRALLSAVVKFVDPEYSLDIW